MVSGRWGLLFKPTELAPATAPKLAALIDRVATEAPFAGNASRLSATLRAHPRAPIEQAVGEANRLQAERFILHQLAGVRCLFASAGQ